MDAFALLFPVVLVSQPTYTTETVAAFSLLLLLLLLRAALLDAVLLRFVMISGVRCSGSNGKLCPPNDLISC
jgi:hypothetical protein